MPQTKKSEDKISLAYRVVKYCGKIFLLWPRDNIGWCDWIFTEICCWILMTNGTFLIIGIIIGTYYFYGDIETFTTVIFVVFEITVIAESMYTSILFKVQRKKFQVLISFLEKNLTNINSPEEILFRKYLKKSAALPIFIYSVYGTLAVGFTYLQLFKPRVILPKEVWHPFPVESSLKQYVVLIQQLMYIYHTGVLHVADGLMFMSMHIATAKLEVLSHEFDRVVDENQLRNCIEKHQEIIWFVNEIDGTCCTIILKTVLAVAFYVILGYLHLLHRHETYDPILVYQFFCMVAFVNYRMFFGAKCADELATMGDNLRFSMPWAGKSSGLSKSMNIVIHRCQKPLTVSVPGIVPAYNLSFYSNFISFTFSYLMTLKAVLNL